MPKSLITGVKKLNKHIYPAKYQVKPVIHIYSNPNQNTKQVLQKKGFKTQSSLYVTLGYNHLHINL